MALGESQQPRALHMLTEKWHRTPRRELRKVLLQAIAALRLEEAIAFLISVLRESSTQTATDALDALSAYKTNERVRDRVGEAVRLSENRELAAAFRESFAIAHH